MAKTLVVLSTQRDDCAARVYAELRTRGHEVLLVDDALSSSELDLNWKTDVDGGCGGWLGVKDRRIAFDDIAGILLRMLNPFSPEPGQEPHDRQYVLIELAAAIEGFANAFPGNVVNRPIPGLSGRNVFSRPDGTELIRRSGFCVPDVFVSSNAEYLGHRLSESGYRRALYAGLHSAFRPCVVENFEEVAGTQDRSSAMYAAGLPTGEIFDVFVAGQAVIGVDTAVRESSELHERVELSESTASTAGRLAASLGLGLARITVLRTPEGEDYCLLVDEFPVYAHCSASIQRDLTSALADVLVAPCEVAA